jgi:hypothetical protein
MAYIRKWTLFQYENFLVINSVKYLEGNAINYMWITSGGNYWQNIVALSKRARTQDIVMYSSSLCNSLCHKNIVFWGEAIHDLIDKYQHFKKKSGAFSLCLMMEEVCCSEMGTYLSHYMASLLIRCSLNIQWHESLKLQCFLFGRSWAEFLPFPHNYTHAEVLHLTEKRIENLISLWKWDLETWQVTEEYSFYNWSSEHLQKCR